MSDDVPPPFLRLAKRASYNSDFKIRVGACIAGKRPLVTGYNKVKTHPKINRPSVHAEMACLLCCNIEVVRGKTIYVYRETKEGPAMARPCDNCLESLRDAGIKRVVYTTNEFPYWKQEYI